MKAKIFDRLQKKSWCRQLLLASLLAVALSGCAMQWTAQWQDAGVDTPTAQSAVLLNQAQVLFEKANDRASLLNSIAAYEKVLVANPGDTTALTMLCTQEILLGTAYTQSSQEKSLHFRRAMTYAERAMYTNPSFRKQVDRGTAPWDAAATLGKDDVQAMFFWVTALQYEFKEGMNLAQKIANINWLQKGLIFLDRIEQVAPEFGGGAVEFAKVICYYALPTSKGGSKVKGDKYMEQAIERGGTRLFPRWARGKYFYPIKDESEKARQDLEWVARQNLAEFDDPYPWKVHFRENARELLN
ncbi:MAG: TRAP transporter TatT component family protein [Desulfuromonadales bacterium]|nr:TRAP transporter TatT component family protein [Desulfuromonadales bacterium]